MEFPCDGVNCSRFGGYEYLMALSDAKSAGTAGEFPNCGKMHDDFVIDRGIYCKACETRAPLCELRIPRSKQEYRMIGSTPARWWRRHVRHAPARGEERRVLGIAKGEYNAGVRVDDDDFDEGRWEPRLGRVEGWWD